MEKKDACSKMIMRPLSKKGGFLLLALYVVWFGFTLINNVWKGLPLEWVFFFNIFFNILIGIPVWMVAENLVAVISIDERGIRKSGFFNRFYTLAWNDLVKIILHSGRDRYREMVFCAKTKRKKIVISNMRRDFWPVAHAILSIADEKGIPLKSSFLSSGEIWLAGEYCRDSGD